MKPELLAPAGDFPSMHAAIRAGADAVYFGLQEFNMRDQAKNFRVRDLPKISKICGGVRKYITLNTIVYDSEVPRMEALLRKIRKYVDAVICWDPSVIMLCKKHKIPFHISTQASIANAQAARFYKRLGAERVVLARELSLKQVRAIAKIMPVEIFIHGAMCVSVSGRCLLSQHLFQRSANRGQCVQVCRRPYTVRDEEGRELKVTNHHVFSAKDLCALPIMGLLKKAGIKAFKIEGRNRDANYVSTVVRVYRKALDHTLSQNEIKACVQELERVYNKGFSTGFLLGTPTADDYSTLEHSGAREHKQFVGKVVNYYPKKEVAIIQLMSGLSSGEIVLVEGHTTGFIKIAAKDIWQDGKIVVTASKGDLISFRSPKVRRNDLVYVLRAKHL